MMEIKEINLGTISDEELANCINEADEWIPEWCEELVRRAGMLDEWEEANSAYPDDVLERCLEVLCKAASELGVKID